MTLLDFHLTLIVGVIEDRSLFFDAILRKRNQFAQIEGGGHFSYYL